MSRVAHRLAGVVSGALVVAAIALPATATAAPVHSAPRATTDITICVNPLNPVWGDGCQH